MIKRSIQLGLSKILKQVLSFIMFAGLCLSRKLNKCSSEFSALKSPPNKNQSYVELKASRQLPI